MKQVIILIMIACSTVILNAQTPKRVSYEATEWKLWLMDKPITVAVPSPVTKAGILAVKNAISSVDAKKEERIRYWNAGAPSYRWNQVAPSLMSWTDVDLVLRSPSAWMNVAIYDATILAWKAKLKHKIKRPAAVDASVSPLIETPATYSYPCEHTVTASAAAHVLAYFYPAKADSLLQLARDASQSRVDAGVQFPEDGAAGWKLGEAVAQAIIEKAKADGSAKKYEGLINKDPTKWTGPYPLGINAQLRTPIVMTKADQFRPGPPPDFATEMKDMKAFKQTFATKSLAFFWAGTGPSYWNEIVSRKIFEYNIHTDAPAAARIYTVMTVAFHDVTIAIMDAKYAYWGIRPSQYDSTYQPLIQTPPFPGYPSGHAAGAGAMAGVLSYFFPPDVKEFDKIAQDCADSRFYAGIHFKTDNEVGLEMGKKLGKYVAESFHK